jgi:hypothetical protein
VDSSDRQIRVYPNRNSIPGLFAEAVSGTIASSSPVAIAQGGTLSFRCRVTDTGVTTRVLVVAPGARRLAFLGEIYDAYIDDRGRLRLDE